MFKFWFSLRLHVQLVLASGLLLAITISIATWFNIEAQKQELLQNATKEAISLANNLSITGSYLIITDRLDELEALLIQSISFPSIRMLRMVSVNGQTLSHVMKLDSGEAKTIYDLSLVALPDTDEIKTIVKTDWQLNQMTVWHPIQTSSLLGWLEMRITLDNLKEVLNQSIQDNVRAAMVAIVFNVLILFVILMMPARSLKKLVQFSDRMLDSPGVQMNFSGGSFEVNELIKSFNITSLKLARQHDEIEEKSKGLIKLNDTLEQRVLDRTQDLKEKNVELERFTYTASHDLKSPLVTISGFIGLLKKDIASGHEARIQSDLNTISVAVNTMQDLLDDLLELSRIGRSKTPHVRVSLNTVLVDVQKSLSALIEKTNAKISVDENLPFIVAEKPRINEVYQNLIENALKYTRDGVAPQIHIGFRLDAKDSNKPPVLYVKDNGIGIDARYHDKIFGLFERMNNQSEGTGVGLAIVKRILEVHNGRIWVKSDTDGKGAEFCFVFP